MRKRCWNGNVVAIGLSSGFLEPLESTSIHLIQSGIQRLIDFFPDSGFDPVEIAEYNRRCRFEYERVRDFVILHYKINQRTDSPFWQDCAAMAVPDTLAHKIELFQARGRVMRIDQELFTDPAWLQVMEGQNLSSRQPHVLADLHGDDAAADYLESVRQVIAKCVDVMPTHEEYLAQRCAAQPA